MKTTVWVKPAMFKNWLVCDSKKNAVDNFEDIFGDLVKGSREKFKQAIENTDLEPELYSKADLEKYDSIECVTVEKYLVKIDFKLVKMTDNEIKSLNEFLGW